MKNKLRNFALAGLTALVMAGCGGEKKEEVKQDKFDIVKEGNHEADSVLAYFSENNTYEFSKKIIKEKADCKLELIGMKYKYDSVVKVNEELKKDLGVVAVAGKDILEINSYLPCYVIDNILEKHGINPKEKSIKEQYNKYLNQAPMFKN